MREPHRAPRLKPTFAQEDVDFLFLNWNKGSGRQSFVSCVNSRSKLQTRLSSLANWKEEVAGGAKLISTRLLRARITYISYTYHIPTYHDSDFPLLLWNRPFGRVIDRSHAREPRHGERTPCDDLPGAG